MRVLFDEQIFQLHRRGGISRYFCELIAAFDADPALGVEPVLNFHQVWNEHAAERLAYRGITLRRGPGYLARAAVRTSLPRQGTAHPNADVVHHTYYINGFLNPAPDVPRVSTIHDMLPERLGVRGRLGRDPHRAKADYVRQSAGIICVSDTTRADLAQFGPATAAVVSTVPLGVGPPFSPDGPAWQADGGVSHLLMVGPRGNYKDADTLWAALSRLPDLADLHLYHVGGGPLTEDEHRRLTALGISQRVHYASADDQRLSAMMRGAVALIYPSRWEGFGLPVAEAMATGCPVIVSSAAALVEVAGDAGVVFDAGDPASLAACLRSLYADAERRDRLRDIGIHRAAEFTWARCAELTADHYRQVLAKA